MPYDTDHDGHPDHDSVTHPLHVGYLVVGLVFLGISAVWAVRAAGVLTDGDLGWLVPAILMAAGAVGLLAYAAKGRGRRGRETDLDPDPGDDR